MVACRNRNLEQHESNPVGCIPPVAVASSPGGGLGYGIYPQGILYPRGCIPYPRYPFVYTLPPGTPWVYPTPGKDLVPSPTEKTWYQGYPTPMDRQIPAKTLPTHNFVVRQ